VLAAAVLRPADRGQEPGEPGQEVEVERDGHVDIERVARPTGQTKLKGVGADERDLNAQAVAQGLELPQTGELRLRHFSQFSRSSAAASMARGSPWERSSA
jgi:hypothetical protein